MSEIKSDQTALFLKPTRFIVYLLLVLFLLAGLGVRLIDLTDLPLDFATTRQLHSYIMSRGYFYEMDTNITRAMPEEIRTFGIETGRNEPQIEPPILEYLVAITYRLTGGENMLFARLLSILFWVIGGIPLFLLVRKVTSLNGAYAALALYLFNPFGVIASRSFQPDPMMVMFILWSLYFQFEWVKKDTLKLAILTGVFTGIAVLIKMPAAFFVGFSLVGIVRDPSGGDVSLFMGSDNKGYFLRVGDEVYDATLISVDPKAGNVTFRQQVVDPRLIKPYRDVVKRLVPLEEDKANE